MTVWVLFVTIGIGFGIAGNLFQRVGRTPDDALTSSTIGCFIVAFGAGMTAAGILLAILGALEGKG